MVKNAPYRRAAAGFVQAVRFYRKMSCRWPLASREMCQPHGIILACSPRAHRPAQRRLRKAKTMNPRNKGFTLVELIVVVAIIAIIAAISIPNLMRAKISANEAGAIQSLRTLVSAQDIFRNTQGIGRYGTLTELRDAVPPCVDPALGSGTCSGYTVSDTGAPGSDTWAAVAVPNSTGSTGNRGFYVDQSGLIRYTNDGSPPDTSSPEIGS